MMYLMHFRRCVAPALALSLAGCSIHPLPENSPLNFPRTSTFDIVQNVRCELQAGLRQLDKAKGKRKEHIEKIIAKSKVGYDFQFKMIEDNNAGSFANAGTLGFTYPSSSSRTLSLGFDAFATRQRRNFRTLQIIEDLADVRTADCSAESRANLAFPISGSLHVDDVARSYLGLERISDLKGQSKFTDPTGIGVRDPEEIGPRVFSEHIRFKTAVTAGIAPTLTLVRVTGRFRATSASIRAEATRSDDHSLIIAFAREDGFSDAEFDRKIGDARAQRQFLRE